MDFSFRDAERLLSAVRQAQADGKPKKVAIGDYDIEVRVIWQP